MTLFDIINATFETCASGFVLLNARDIWRRKAVAGQTAPTLVFFTAWGVWNIVYYPSLDQWASTAGAWGVTIANALTLALVLKYRKPAPGDPFAGMDPDVRAMAERYRRWWNNATQEERDAMIAEQLRNRAPYRPGERGAMPVQPRENNHV